MGPEDLAASGCNHVGLVDAWDKVKRLDAASISQVDRQIVARAELHDEVDVGVIFLSEIERCARSYRERLAERR